jgi:biopolymer transport protein ExbD
MAKLKMPKGSPTIDMTPMVDLAFLLVTFFMLAATFRSEELTTVTIPSSIGDEEIPEKTLVQVTVTTGGQVFFTVAGDTNRRLILEQVLKNFNSKPTAQMSDEFAKSGNIGCSISNLGEFFAMSSEERKAMSAAATVAIPIDTAITKKNELAMWLTAARDVMNARGKVQFENETAKQAANAKALDPYDFKPRFVLKVSGESEYVRVKAVIETFRDLNLNNLNFITSQEAKPVTQ